jgi:predicted amidohydrolase
MRKFLKIIALPAVALLVYFFWAETGREPLSPPADSNFRAFDEFGSDLGKGNLVGIQPYVQAIDYSGEAAFLGKMSGYFEQAKRRGWLNAKSIVVLPEYLGSWLVAANEKTDVYDNPQSGRALQTVVLSNFFSFLRHYFQAPEGTKDPVKYALFSMKSAQMAGIYHRTFSTLAQKYGVTVVAGSILLRNPSIEGGALQVGEGHLYNVSVVYRPDGTPHPQLVKKLFPINDELPFVCPANPADLPVFDTPAGRLGVLICADCWNSAAYTMLKRKKAQLLAVPSYSALDGVWGVPWGGYSGTPTPPEAKADVGRITEGEAWAKYSMGGRAKSEAGIGKGINVFLRGKIWDLGSDGRTLVLSDSLMASRQVAAPAITCLWL